jgi:Protein of unknown function (DUF3102)
VNEQIEPNSNLPPGEQIEPSSKKVGGRNKATIALIEAEVRSPARWPMSGRVVSRKKATEEDNQNTFGFVDGAWEYRHAGQLIPIADLSLDMMAIGIKSHRESAERCFSHGVEHAIGAGELLIAAKKKVKHGEWLPSLESHCELALRTAQAYMQLARLPVEKRNAVAHLPVKEALSPIRHREQKLADAAAREAEPPGEAELVFQDDDGNWVRVPAPGLVVAPEHWHLIPPSQPLPPSPPPTVEDYARECVRQLDQLLYEIRGDIDEREVRRAVCEMLARDLSMFLVTDSEYLGLLPDNLEPSDDLSIPTFLRRGPSQ